MRPRGELSIKQRVLLVAASSLLALTAALGFLRVKHWNRDSDAFYIYVLGGSSAWGEPYAPYVPDVLGRLVAAQFGDKIAGRSVKVVTLAQAGASIEQVAARADEIVRQKHEPGTAVALIYAGHNEFIRSDDHRDLRDNPRQLIDVPVVPPEMRRQMLDAYLAGVKEITEKLRSANVPVVISTVASNIRDWDPNRSSIASPEHADRVTELWNTASAALAKHDWDVVKSACGELLSLEPHFAHGHFMLGEALLETGDGPGARGELLRAADDDTNPTRGVSQQNAGLIDFCTKYNVPLADSLRAMESASPDGLVGNNLIWDNVHPRLEAFILMARAFSERVEQVTGTPRVKLSLDLAAVEKSLGINRELMGTIYAGRGQTCYGHATRTWAPERRLSQAEFYFKKALEIQPRDPDVLCSVAVMQLMKGETKASLATWRKAMTLDPDVVRRRIGNLHVRQLFARQGIKDAMAQMGR